MHVKLLKYNTKTKIYDDIDYVLLQNANRMKMPDLNIILKDVMLRYLRCLHKIHIYKVTQ